MFLRHGGKQTILRSVMRTRRITSDSFISLMARVSDMRSLLSQNQLNPRKISAAFPRAFPKR